MRTAFANTLCELAAANERIWLLTGDLGFSVLEPFQAQFPRRYVNVGVAEQNLVGLAAGIASTGRIVFVYSIANFATLRSLEQVRNDVCYNDMCVKVVSVGGGFAYGPQGYTHHGIEDLAVMRALPNMTVIAPGDPVETELATRALATRPGPGYLRLGKAREPIVHASPPRFEIGRAICVQAGNDVTLISTGGMLAATMAAAERLAIEHNIGARVLSMPTLKPLDEEAIRTAARETAGIVAVEEHSVIGGLGSAVADVLATMPQRAARFRKFGVPDRFEHAIGSQDYLRQRLMGDLVEAVCTLLGS